MSKKIDEIVEPNCGSFGIIIGERCFLSPTSIFDCKNWSTWLNISQEDARKKIEEIHRSMQKYFSIINSGNEEPIGT